MRIDLLWSIENEGSTFVWLAYEWARWEGSNEKEELKEPRGRLPEPEGDGRFGMGGILNVGLGGVVIVVKSCANDVGDDGRKRSRSGQALLTERDASPDSRSTSTRLVLEPTPSFAKATLTRH